MAKVVPNALILGHSFVRRLKRYLELGFDPRAISDFNLRGTASVHLHGVGGRVSVELCHCLRNMTLMWSRTLLQILLSWK